MALTLAQKSANNKKWYAKNRERERAKRCERSRLERELCPENSRARGRKHYKENTERVRAQKRAAYSRDLEHTRALKRERQKRYRERHPDRIREINRTQYVAKRPERLAAAIKYQSENRGTTVKANRNNRRARMRAAPGKITKVMVIEIRAAQGDACVYCRVDLKGAGHLDHRKALARGGTNLRDNLQLTCPTCNHRKGAKEHREFLAEAA